MWAAIRKRSWCPSCNKSKTQKLLNSIIKNIFIDYVVETEFRGFEWLKTTKVFKQHIDIYVPFIKLAIEYDGQQHFYPVCFGGVSKEDAKEHFIYTKEMDKMKNEKIAAHPEDIITFIRIPYTEQINKDNIVRILCENDVLMPA
jgi:very-short-patch-repair endonuclease